MNPIICHLRRCRVCDMPTVCEIETESPRCSECAQNQTEEEDISTSAISFFGERSQITKCCEELAELSVELCKWHNLTEDADIKHIQEEIADVQIMLDQMVVMFDCRDAVKSIKQSKIERLRGLMS